MNAENPGNIIMINAAADGGSDIDAIKPKQSAHYEQLHLVKTDERGIVIGICKLPIHVKKCVLSVVVSEINKRHNTKFWCLDSKL